MQHLWIEEWPLRLRRKKLISQEPVNIQGKDLPNGQTEDLKREAREDQKTRAETISETVDSVKKIRKRTTAVNESLSSVALCVFSVALCASSFLVTHSPQRTHNLSRFIGRVAQRNT
jgi:hypothetical protein